MPKCTICEKEIHEKAVICPGCGCAVETAAPVRQIPVQNAVPRTNANVPLIATIAVIVIVIGLIAAVGLYLDRRDTREWQSEYGHGWQPPQMSELPQIQRPQGNSREGQLYDLYVQQVEQWLQQQERILQHAESQAMQIMEINKNNPLSPLSNPYFVAQVLQNWELTWEQWDHYKAQWEQQKREMERLTPRQRDELVQQMRQRMLQQQYVMQQLLMSMGSGGGGGGGGGSTTSSSARLCGGCYGTRDCGTCNGSGIRRSWGNSGVCGTCRGTGRCTMCR